MDKKTFNVKKWVKEHKSDIRDVGLIFFGVGCAFVGLKVNHAIVSKRIGNPVVVEADSVAALLIDAQRNATPASVFCGIHDVGLKAEELGELGKGIMAQGNYTPDHLFTHFIAIGKTPNT